VLTLDPRLVIPRPRALSRHLPGPVRPGGRPPGRTGSVPRLARRASPRAGRAVLARGQADTALSRYGRNLPRAAWSAPGSRQLPVFPTWSPD